MSTKVVKCLQVSTPIHKLDMTASLNPELCIRKKNEP